MLHVRVVSPPGSTGHLVERLSADPGVRNLVVMPGAARRPDGDAVQFDRLTRFANPVLRELRARVQDHGSVVIQNVDAAITGPGEAAEHRGQRYGEVPPVWELVESTIRAGGEYPLSFFALLVIAGLIGAVGILTNSQILIVAAMVVGPEYGAIMATALGIDKRDRRAVRHGLAALAAGFALAVLATLIFGLLIIAGLIGAVGILTNSQILIVAAMVVGPEYGAIMATALGIDKSDGRAVRQGLAALVAGFALAVLATLIFGLLIRWSGETPRLYEAGVRPVSELINSPNVFSVIVAVLAGVVGVVSLTESRANALIGVFISVTTIPAASDMGLSAAYGSWTEARGSTFQLLLNVVLLVAVGALGLRLQRSLWRGRSARAAARARRSSPDV